MVGQELIKTSLDTEALCDTHIAELHSGLQDVNKAIAICNKTPMYAKAEAAQQVIELQTRLQAKTIFTLHILANEINRLKKG